MGVYQSHERVRALKAIRELLEQATDPKFKAWLMELKESFDEESSDE